MESGIRQPPRGLEAPRRPVVMAPAVEHPAGFIGVTDPFAIDSDPALLHAAEALDPVAVARAFELAKFPIENLSGDRLRAIRVTRHKPGRRCVIEYDLAAAGDSPEMTLIGKIRRQRSGRSAFELSRAFTVNGFHGTVKDGVSVPDAIAYVKQLGLWLQRKVPGQEATELLVTPAGPRLAEGIAEAAFKIHRSNVPVRRVHGMDDEIQILESCLDRVGLAYPAWKSRLWRLQLFAERLAQTLGSRDLCGIHRDFYADQIIVDGNRLWLLDFDLYCQGDPALDIGNFIGHVTELGLRLYGYPKALAAVERAMEDRYVALAGESMRYPIRVYSLLTLLRHIYISTLHESRQHTTEWLITLCELRLVDMLCDSPESNRNR